MWRGLRRPNTTTWRKANSGGALSVHLLFARRRIIKKTHRCFPVPEAKLDHDRRSISARNKERNSCPKRLLLRS